MNQAEALYHLQEVDLLLARLQKRIAEIDAVLADDQAVAAAQAQVKAAQAVLPPLRTHAHDLELEVAGTLQKATATEDQLYSGRVKNTKEMQDMQQEVVLLRKRHGELEETLLDVMVSIEDGEAGVKTAEDALRAVLESRTDTHRALLDERDDLTHQVSRGQEERTKALKPVLPESLTLYNQLRPRKRNQPVAVMRGESCTACGVQQNQTITREAQIGQSLVLCLSCGRILLYRGPAD